MTAFLYVAVVLCALSQSTLDKLDRRKDAVRYNFFKAFAACIVFFVAFFISREGFHAPTLYYGMAQGALFAVANFAGYQALHKGPMALTSMLVKFSLIIPFLFGVIRLQERPSVAACVGFVLLFAALACLNLRRGSHEKKPLTLPWALLVLATLLANGFTSVLTSAHQNAYPGEYAWGYTAWATASCFVLFLLPALFSGRLSRRCSDLRADALACTSGTANTLSSFLTVLLAAAVPATILYPLLSVAMMLGALLLGRILFREKLSVPQYVGFALGACSVVLLNL